MTGKFPTNLCQHLKKKHPVQYSELLVKEEKEKKEKEKLESAKRAKPLKVSQQQTLTESLLSKSAYRKDSVCYGLISKKLAIFIGSLNVPTNIVNNLVLKDRLHTMDNRYEVPGRWFIGKEIDKVFIELKAKIGSYLQEANRISICADIWSKKGMSSSYLGITGHFYSQKDHLRHCVTLAVRMPSPHTGENIRELVDIVLDKWEIPLCKVSATLTDNGSNMLAAFRPRVSERCNPDDDQEEYTSSLVSDFETRELDHELSFAL